MILWVGERESFLPQEKSKHFSQGERAFRREYHQSCAQPGFRADKKKVPFWASSAYFPVFGGKKGRKKTRAQPLVRA